MLCGLIVGAVAVSCLEDGPCSQKSSVQDYICEQSCGTTEDTWQAAIQFKWM